MFRHQGKSRTVAQNLQIASVLSFVAGIVNISGFLAVQQLTTNVTGHFAYFVDDFFQFHFLKAFIFLVYVLSFLAGSFLTSLIIETISKKSKINSYFFPISIEILILLIIAFFGELLEIHYSNIIVCSLLFAMGLQNAMVTKISNATVRTTHLTGLFTDLGIELAQLFFYKQPEKRTLLFSSIKLRLTIISFFFLGGIIGGFFFSKFRLKVLIIAVLVLIFGLIFDYLKLKIIIISRQSHR